MLSVNNKLQAKSFKDIFLTILPFTVCLLPPGLDRSLVLIHLISVLVVLCNYRFLLLEPLQNITVDLLAHLQLLQLLRNRLVVLKIVLVQLLPQLLLDLFLQHVCLVLDRLLLIPSPDLQQLLPNDVAYLLAAAVLVSNSELYDKLDLCIKVLVDIETKLEGLVD